ncbi:hypothetical protein LRQ04_07540 [Paenarthrobacter sp. AR 02]|uniref:hypothetical protein n=1 Tax=Paenarthrobacter sp. AR 02 TaxID=2899821 RepID=UPI001F41182B|nr:hypothetical protein [Paenarthrobacter sp. AR 02]MCF3139108.1 hypothetical protein [Paenarthrobacter sp. AR 02]
MDVVQGPEWSEGTDGRYAGRYPLAVERHVLRCVAELLPGVTTVTRNARYYSLHGYVAGEAQLRNLNDVESLDLLRRAETVVAAVSILHDQDHSWLPRAHGADYLTDKITDEGLNLELHSKPGKYAALTTGFRGPYQASEQLLGLAASDGDSMFWSHHKRIRRGFSGLIELAGKSRVSLSELREHAHLCICGARHQDDGVLLRELLTAKTAPDETDDGKRKQSIRMFLRLVEMAPPNFITKDLSNTLNFDPAVREDRLLSEIPVTSAWQGVSLRSRSVGAWRALWAYLVKNIPGLCHRDDFSTPLVDSLPTQTVSQYLEDLPDTWMHTGQALPAEVDGIASRKLPERHLATLFLGSARLPEMPEGVRPYFETKRDASQEFSPSWFSNALEDWADRQLRDFAHDLCRLMLLRANRIALRKARFDAISGITRVPTRIFFRDDLIFKDSNEGGDNVSLRWEPLMSVLSGVNLVIRDEDERWHLTEQGAMDLA